MVLGRAAEEAQALLKLKMRYHCFHLLEYVALGISCACRPCVATIEWCDTMRCIDQCTMVQA